MQTVEIETLTHAVVNPRERGRLQWLDSIRGIAALCVVLEHFMGHWVPAYRGIDYHVFHLGYGAVLAFLLVSGYVIPMTLERHNDLAVFWRLRVFRLYPMYLLALAGTVALMFVKRHTYSDYNSHFWTYSLANATMLQDWFRIPAGSFIASGFRSPLPILRTCTSKILSIGGRRGWGSGGITARNVRGFDLLHVKDADPSYYSRVETQPRLIMRTWFRLGSLLSMPPLLRWIAQEWRNHKAWQRRKQDLPNIPREELSPRELFEQECIECGYS